MQVHNPSGGANKGTCWNGASLSLRSVILQPFAVRACVHHSHLNAELNDASNTGIAGKRLEQEFKSKTAKNSITTRNN
jgi:hypothetical protein